MKKKTVLLLTLVLPSAFAIFTIITMAIYIKSYEPWFSFMTLNGAIIVLIIASLVMLAIIGVVLLLLFKKKTRRSD